MSNSKRMVIDVFDSHQNKWIQGEIISNDEYSKSGSRVLKVQFQGWSNKWNLFLENIPDKYIKKAFTYTKRFRPKIGDLVQLKIQNIGKENIYDFIKYDKYNYQDKIYHHNLVKSDKDVWKTGLVIKKSGKFVSVLYILNEIVCIIKIKRDSNIICENKTHFDSFDSEKNIYKEIFLLLKNDYNKIKNLKLLFLNDLKERENILDYIKFDFVLECIIDNIHFFEEHEQKISFLKMILLYKKRKFEKRCYFELAHLYMINNTYNKKIIFRYLCLSGHTNIAIKYVQDKIKLENNSNDPIDILYDLII
jgi:hypothetical protein